MEGKKTNSMTLTVIIVFGTALVVFLLIRNQLSDACLPEISFQPATETLQSENVFGSKQGEAAHYTYSGRKFETREDALDYCLSQKW